MSVRNKRSRRGGQSQGLRPCAEFTVHSSYLESEIVPRIAYFNDCQTMAKSERWWRCVATVYGADKDGNEMSHVVVLDSEEKVQLAKIIDDSNKKLHSCLLEIGMAMFNRAECRCIILPEDPKLTKLRLGKTNGNKSKK